MLSVVSYVLGRSGFEMVVPLRFDCEREAM